MRETTNRIVRVLNRYIEENLTDTAELSELLKKNRRTIQAYLDLTDNRFMPANDVAFLARYFGRMGRYELGYIFLPESVQVQALVIGRATGDTGGIVTRIVKANGLVASADGNIEQLAEADDLISEIQADLRAEIALCKSRMQKSDDHE